MKATWLILLLLLQAELSANAQPYQSIFGNNSTHWIYNWKDEFGNHNDTSFITKDTVVNGLTYKLMPRWACLLREDVNTGAVWCKGLNVFSHPEDTLERIASKMDLDVGDTFDLSSFMYSPGQYPDSFNIVDSIRIINSLKYIYFKALHYNAAQNEPFTLIEGVGPNVGIFYKYTVQHPPAPWGGGNYLLCSYKDGIKTAYENRKFNGACWMYSNSERLDELGNDISLYPQPAFTEITISNNTNHKITKAIIISPAGVTLKIHSSPSAITHINIVDIPSGYYFIKLFTDGGSVFTKPLVVR